MHTAPKNNLTEGKPRPSLLPLDVLMRHLCSAYEEGIIKYERESWRNGFLVSTMIDAALRHIIKFFWEGEDLDSESKVGNHHLSAAIFSLISILHTLDTKPALDDRHKQLYQPIVQPGFFRKAWPAPDTKTNLNIKD
jgi:hypothetical protein